jgi:hypothetical protein
MSLSLRQAQSANAGKNDRPVGEARPSSESMSRLFRNKEGQGSATTAVGNSLRRKRSPVSPATARKSSVSIGRQALLTILGYRSPWAKSTPTTIAQENVAAFDSSSASLHQPIILEAEVRSSYSIWKKGDLLVKDISFGGEDGQWWSIRHVTGKRSFIRARWIELIVGNFPDETSLKTLSRNSLMADFWQSRFTEQRPAVWLTSALGPSRRAKDSFLRTPPHRECIAALAIERRSLRFC